MKKVVHFFIEKCNGFDQKWNPLGVQREPKIRTFVVFSRLLPRNPQKPPKCMLNELKMNLKWMQNWIKMESKWSPKAEGIAVAAMTAARISNRLRHKLQTGCKKLVPSKCRIWVRLNRTEVLVPPLEPEFRDLSFWNRFGVDLGSFWGPLGSFWGNFGDILG